jgi:light-regulated signal transduction histidine kinase (bacteriophytochrome)
LNPTMIKPISMFIFDHKEVVIAEATRKELIEIIEYQAREVASLRQELERVAHMLRGWVRD